jgi:hypothetical protein
MDFSFGHFIPRGDLLREDLLGPLRPLVGPKGKRKWRGSGFNLIWRPNFEPEFGDQNFFLQLNLTEEEVEFTDITGSGIANRSLFERTVALGGVAYVQSIIDSFDLKKTGQHFESGVLANVPGTSVPGEPATVVRMASIPHGTTINLQGTAEPVEAPVFETASITPFIFNHSSDTVDFFEEDLERFSRSRTERSRVPTLTKEKLRNPNLFLEEELKEKTVVSATVLRFTSDASLPGSTPKEGGGLANIAMLAGENSCVSEKVDGVGARPLPYGEVNAVTPRGGAEDAVTCGTDVRAHAARATPGPNAKTHLVTATLWIEQLQNLAGVELTQLQYSQRVLLHFNGLLWPHITVGTLRIEESSG